MDIQFILFCGGNNLSSDWKKVQGMESDLIPRLESLSSVSADIYMNDPPFYFNDKTIMDFKQSQKDNMFNIKDLDIEEYCKKVYTDIEKENKTYNILPKLFLITWSRGYLYGNVFAHMYPDHIIGYINIDGGKPDEEYEHILKNTDCCIKNEQDLKNCFKKIKETNDDDELKELRRCLSKFVMLEQFLQYKKSNQRIIVPMYILNNIYNDSEISVNDPMYCNKTLKWKIDYNEYVKNHYNAKSIWYTGKKHWLHAFKEVVDDIINITNQQIDRYSVNEKQIYIVRHGETSWNELGLAQGSQNDIPLNEKGIDQTIKLAEYLRDHRINDEKFDLIVSSPMIRTMETAKIIARIIGYENQIIPSDNLIETDHGLLAIGKTHQELVSDPFYDEFFELMDGYRNLDPLEQLETKDEFPQVFITKYKMESTQNIKQRIQKFIRFLKLVDAKKILCVTHADTIRSLNCIIMNSVSEINGDLTNGKNCHLTYYKLKDGKFKLIIPPSTFYLKNNC